MIDFIKFSYKIDLTGDCIGIWKILLTTSNLSVKTYLSNCRRMNLIQHFQKFLLFNIQKEVIVNE